MMHIKEMSIYSTDYFFQAYLTLKEGEKSRKNRTDNAGEQLRTYMIY